MKFIKLLTIYTMVVLGLFSLSACRRQQGDPRILTYWMPLGQNVSANFTNMGLTPYGRALQERTGIQVEYIHPSGNATEQFNLIIASNDMPDIMEGNWLNYPGGPENAIAEGVILRLNDIFEQYAPNLMAFLAANPDIDRMIRTDSGSYYCFPFIRGDFMLLLSTGLIVRQDWLDELGLELPQTIDDWYSVLSAFRDAKGLDAPFTNYNLNNMPFAYAFGVIPRNFMIGMDGSIVYSPIEDGYRDYLATLAQWYREGLIDPDILTNNFNAASTKMTRGTSGAVVAPIGSGIGVWTASARQQNPSFALAGAPIPVLNRGDRPHLSFAVHPYPGIASAAITAQARDIERAARFLDYSYSEEGMLLNNFGIEGESFNWVDGYPLYTDFIMQNPNGWPIAQALAAYARSQAEGPFVQDARFREQYFDLPEQKQAFEAWSFPEMLKHIVPPITPTPAESAEMARIMSEVNIYQREMESKFIIGTEPMTNWTTYVTTIRRMNIDRAIEIMNLALERYNVR